MSETIEANRSFIKDENKNFNRLLNLAEYSELLTKNYYFQEFYIFERVKGKFQQYFPYVMLPMCALNLLFLLKYTDQKWYELIFTVPMGVILFAALFTAIFTAIKTPWLLKEKKSFIASAYNEYKSEYDRQVKENELVNLSIKQKQEEQAKWQLELDREIERERRLAEVRNQSTLVAMKSQVAIYAEYKEKGLSVEKEIFEMRAKLLELEGQENKAMLDEIRTTLDSLA